MRRAIGSWSYHRSTLSVAAEALLLCTLLASPSLAKGHEPPEDHFSADAAALYQRVSQVTPAAGADVLFLDDEETVVFDTEGRAVRSRYFLYKILTQKGAEGWGAISSSWEPWHVERPSMRARVITADNAVHLLDEKTITDAPAEETQDNVFSDRRVLRAPLPAVAPGSLVEEELTSKESAPLFGAGSVERFYFGASVPVQHTHLALDAPSALSLRYEVDLLPDLKSQRNEAEGRVRLTFDYGPMDALDDVEAELPSDVPAYPSVTFSTGDSWRQIAETYGKVVDKQIAGADLKSLVSKLTAGKAPRDAKAATILQYLNREVRYTGVEFGEAALMPHSLSETLARKYGDCKDKASLLVAMLRAANIPAYVALLNAGSREDITPGLPGMGMFDHAIVYVPGNVPGDADLWIDATDEYARLGEIPIADQDRFALIVRSGGDSLVRIPATSPQDNALIEKREIFLAENGPAKIVETSLPHGSIESSYRRAYADKQNKAAKDELANYVKSQYLAEKLDRMDRSDPTDLSRQFELVLESDRAKRGVTDLNSAAAAIRFEGLFSRLPSGLRQREKEDDNKTDKDSGQKPKKKRTADYQLPEAFVTEWDYSIVPPAGFRPKPLPVNAQLSLGPCTLTEDFAADKDGVVHATLRFDTVKRRLTVSEATELRNKVAQLIAGEPILVYFEPIGQTLLSQGKAREALQSYRELIALHPQEAVHHLQIAEVLLSSGLGEAARAEAQAAVKLEPNSALAEKTLADILEYDSVGRKFRPGSDYAGAEAAFRAAEELDPDDKASVANLAVLLEYNRWGLRYGPGARLKDALVEYRKLPPEKLAEFNMGNNIAFALFYDSQFSEAQKEAETLNPPPLALIVACEAALHGSQAALAEARKSTGQEEQFRQIVDTAGRMLINLRKYPLGADLEEAGATGPNAAENAAFVSLYRRTVPYEQRQFPDDPAGVALRYVALGFDPKVTAEQWLTISSRNGAKIFSAPITLRSDIGNARGRLSRDARKGDFTDVLLDLTLTRSQPKVQGNDTNGYKLITQTSDTYRHAVYIVKEDGHYKVLGSSFRGEAVGLETLDRIAAGDLSGARVLLDWFREDYHLGGGDDPLAGDAFPRMWTKGQDADVRHMTIAAATILMNHYLTAAKGLSILESNLNSALNDIERRNILLAMMLGYDVLDDYEKALSVRTELAKQYPESESLFLDQSFDLRALSRFDEADALAEKRLERMPGDLAAMRALAYVAQQRGEYEQAQTVWQKVIEGGPLNANDLNNTAWNSIFAGKTGVADAENALKATQLNKNDAASLHTLGCLYAELGRTKEAREVLIQAMDSLNLDEPNDDYWYAFGRIAEQYGEREVAVADYKHVTKPEQAFQIPTSPYHLAQLRLEALQKEKR